MITVLEPKTHVTEEHLPMKYIKDPVTFLVDSGLLFEVNRRVLHPLGLALAVDEERALAAKSEHGGITIWDNRDDPEGVYFAPETLDEGEVKLAKTVSAAKPRLEERRKALGYVIQGMSPEETAQRAYDAYGDSTGWVNFIGKQMPLWLDLPPKIQQAWRDATAAVVEP
jgi:hypothetical protein